MPKRSHEEWDNKRVANQTYKFIRRDLQEYRYPALPTASIPTTVAPGSIANYGTYSFIATDVPFSDLAAVFDEYKLEMIKVIFVPSYNDNSATQQTTQINQALPYIHIWFDPDNTANPTSLQSFETQEGEWWHLDGIREYKIYPRVLQTATDIADSATIPAPWLDTVNGNVPHVGVKWWNHTYQSYATVVNYSYFQVYLEYYMAFKFTSM